MIERMPKISVGTRRNHRREMFWQVYFPLVVGVAFFGLLIYLVLSAGNGTLERGAQIAVILLSVVTLVLGLVVLAGAILLNYGMAKVLAWLPPQTVKLQDIANRINLRVQRTAKQATQVLMALDSPLSALKKVFERGQG